MEIVKEIFRSYDIRGIYDERVTDLIINDIKQGKIKGITFDRIKDYEIWQLYKRRIRTKTRNIKR